MDRLRHRPDYFMYRGNRFYFHRLADGPTLARLDPYTDGEQTWPLNSGRTIDVTAAEIRDITLQVHGIELPEVNPDLKFISDPTLEPRLAALEKLVAELAERLSALAVEPLPVIAAAPEPLVIEKAPEPVAPQEPTPDPRDEESEAVLDPDPVVVTSEPSPVQIDAGEREEIVSGFIDILKNGRSVVEDTFRQMHPDERVKLFPLLNAELARLNNQEALLGRAIPRKAEVESLIGILAKVGEA